MNTRFMVYFGVLMVWALPRSATPSDCNQNGVDDALDTSTPLIDFSPDRVFPSLSPGWVTPWDLDGDGDQDLVAHDTWGGPHLVFFENRGGADLVLKDKVPLNSWFSVTMEDLNLDGAPEIILVEDHSVVVRWSERGTIQGESRLELPQHPRSMLAVDLDRDGDPDLAALNALSTLEEEGPPTGEAVSVIENLGSGRFGPPLSFGGDLSLAHLAPGDMDSDGDLDLVGATHEPARLFFFENRNGLGFERSEEPVELPGSSIDFIVLADLDGDGGDEVLISGRPPGLMVLSKKGPGLPSVAGTIDLGVGKASRVLPIDVDGDRKLDLVAPGYGCPDLQVLLGDGTGAFPARRRVQAGLRLHLVAAADWNGDGALDLVGGSYGSIAILVQGASASSRDCNRNGVPDECEADCNLNDVPDDCDLAAGTSLDCNRNGVVDDCDPDCDGNRLPDDCDVRSRPEIDCDRNGIPDACELGARDGDRNDLLDDCEIAGSAALDCNRNGVLDSLEVRPGFAFLQEENPVNSASLVLADLDGDADLEVIGARGAGLSLLETLPDGSLAGPRDYPLGAAVHGLAALDADGDGALDLAALLVRGSCHGWVGTLLNRGGLQLARGPAYPIPATSGNLVVGRLNHDPWPDLVVSMGDYYTGKGNVWWLRGLGGGAYEPPAMVSSRFGGNLVVRDLNGDGYDDIALAPGRLIFSRGDGTFFETGSVLVKWSHIDAGDLDQDGDVDLLLDGRRLAFNQGDGTFLTRDLGIAGSRGDPGVIGDFQGDGRLDIAVPTSLHGPAATLFLNQGAGVFDGGTPFRLCTNLSFSSPVAGDLEGDGDLDIVGGLVLRNGGEGSFRNRAAYAVGEAPRWVQTADLDGDGDLDLIGTQSNQTRLSFFENDGRGSYERKLGVSLNGFPGAAQAADLSGDGRIDLVVPETIPETARYRLSVFTNRGGWAFNREYRSLSGDFSGGLLARDLDNDGSVDLLAHGRSSGEVTLFLNDGLGHFGPPAVFKVDDPGFITAARLDGDELTDLIISGPESLRIFKNKGGGGFLESGRLSARSPMVAVAGDLDQDGDNDLVFGVVREGQCMASNPACGSQIAVAFNEGDGTWNRLLTYPAAQVVAGASLSDLDRDGDLDLVALFQSGEAPRALSLVTFRNEGDGSLAEAGRLRLDGSLWGASSGGELNLKDLDGDQAPDLVWADGKSISVLAGAWRPAASPDLDRDGVPDDCASESFQRGDVDDSGRLNLGDAVALLGHLFRGGPAPPCPDAADFDDSGAL